MSTYLFLGFLVGVVVAVMGFDGIGLFHLLITMATTRSQNVVVTCRQHPIIGSDIEHFHMLFSIS